MLDRFFHQLTLNQYTDRLFVIKFVIFVTNYLFVIEFNPSPFLIMLDSVNVSCLQNQNSCFQLWFSKKFNALQLILFEDIWRSHRSTSIADTKITISTEKWIKFFKQHNTSNLCIHFWKSFHSGYMKPWIDYW